MKMLRSRKVHAFIFYISLMALVIKVTHSIGSGWKASQEFEKDFTSAECTSAIAQFDQAEASFYPLNRVFVSDSARRKRQECSEFSLAQQAQLAEQPGSAMGLYLQFFLRNQESFLANAAQKQATQILAKASAPGQLAGNQSCAAVSWAIHRGLLNWEQPNVPALVLTCARLAAQNPPELTVAAYLYQALLTATPPNHPVVPFARNELAALPATVQRFPEHVLRLAPPLSDLRSAVVADRADRSEPIDQAFMGQTLPLLLATILLGIWTNWRHDPVKQWSITTTFKETLDKLKGRFYKHSSKTSSENPKVSQDSQSLPETSPENPKVSQDSQSLPETSPENPKGSQDSPKTYSPKRQPNPYSWIPERKQRDKPVEQRPPVNPEPPQPTVIPKDFGQNRTNASATGSSREKAPNRQLEAKLVQLVNGNRDTAKRLVDSERRRQPGESEDWYWRMAIERLLRDRR